MIDLHDRAGGPERGILRQLLHRQDWAAGDVELVENVHRLELGLGHRPLLDAREDGVELGQARLGGRVLWIGFPVGFADGVADRGPYGRLRDEVDVGVGVGLPTLALQDAAGLTAARVIARARHRITEGDALAVLAVFGEGTVGEPLLVAQLDARQIEDAILHGAGDLLADAGGLALVECSDDAEREMQARPRVADLRARHERRAIPESGGGRRAAGALRDVLVDLAILVGSRAEALYGSDDHLGVQRVNALPREAHAIEHAGAEILHEHVARRDETLEHLFALGVLGVERNRAFVVVQHREIEAIDVRHVLELSARDVTGARTLDFDHVGAEPSEKLRARGA